MLFKPSDENRNFEGKVVDSFDFKKAVDMRKNAQSYEEIAEFFNTSVDVVKKHLLGHFDEDRKLEAFKKQKADELVKKQKMILDSIDDDTIQAATLKERAVALDLLIKNSRLEENKSTENVAHSYGEMVERVHAKRKANRVVDAEVLE